MYDIIFNIIYTPHTVRYLLPFAESIVHFNNITIRLASNNCTKEEEVLLESKAKTNKSFLFYKVKTNRILLHHEVLNELYEINDGAYFLFMDSDIFCNDLFIPFFMDKMMHCSGIFSCKPILESPITPEINKLQGRHFHDRNNKLIGGSYYAVYKRSEIEKAKKELGFIFDRKNWDELDKDLQGKLEAKNMAYDRYDTGKLLNFCIRENGGQLEYHEHPHLFHIGGISWNDSLIEQKPKKPIFPNNILGNVLRKRQIIAKYFSDYIASCIDQTEQPIIPSLSLSENLKLEEVTQELRKLYQS